METRGHNRTPWWLPSNGNVQNCSHFSTYRRIPCFAVPDWGGYNRVPRPATLAEPSGGRYGRTSSWHAAIPETARDRKSTRLNSSHSQISYAVFCLKKKKKR